VGMVCRGSAGPSETFSPRSTKKRPGLPGPVRRTVPLKNGVRRPIDRPMRMNRHAPVAALGLAVGMGCLAAATSRADDWRSPAVLVMLLLFAIAADRVPIETKSGSPLVGSFPVFVLVAVLFGPAPGAAVAIAASLVQPRKAWQLVAGDLGVYATFPVLAGLAARASSEVVDGPLDPWFLLVGAASYMLAWALNAGLVIGYMRILCDRRIELFVATVLSPLLATQLAHAVAVAGLIYAYERVGAVALAFAGVVVLTYSRLQRDLMDAERLRDEAEARNAELAAANERLRRAHFGAMRSLVRSIHLHDQMTARHSAAVARYARAIAKAAGRPEAEQQLVHTAGLLHDVGKHILDDAILKGDSKLDDEQWELVKRHPEEGARIVRLLEGQEDVAAIIHAHHERIDGRGYPRGLAGEDVPLLSRMISIADTYDVMTARDSYRDPVSSADAVAELRSVAGAQLDAELVEIFVRQVLQHEDTAFAHGDDADFEAELAFERLALPAGDPGAGAASVAA
jgi:putative nucleotidyltransferase with HDIG domain